MRQCGHVVSTFNRIELAESHFIPLLYQLMDRGVKSIVRKDPDIEVIVHVLTEGIYVKILVVRVVHLRLWFETDSGLTADQSRMRW